MFLKGKKNLSTKYESKKRETEGREGGVTPYRALQIGGGSLKFIVVLKGSH